METGATEPNPDLPDLLQDEPVAVSSVPVRGEGTFLTHDLPAGRAQMKADFVPSTGWTSILSGTPKRKRVVLLSTDQPFYVSTDGIGTGGFLWPINVPLELKHTMGVSVMSANVAGSNISHCSELWAD